MKRVIYMLITVSSLLMSCTDGFDDMNVPKTGSTTVSPDYVFTRSLVTGSGLSYTVWQQLHQTSSSQWGQHWANIVSRFTGDNYKPSPADDIWDFYYSRQYFAPLMYNHQVMQLIQETDGNPIKMSCAKIWNVYMFHHMTDSWGDIPYSEAFKSLKPRYDTQEYVYEDMLKTLSEAIQTIKADRNKGYPTFGSADVLYKGDLDNWIKFANALTLRLSLRVSNVAANLGKSYVEKIDLNEVMTSNDQSARILSEVKTKAQTHEVKNAIGFVYSWQEVRISKTLMDHLDGTKYGGIVDPRLKVFAEPAKADGQFRGLPNGQDNQALAGDPDYYKDNFCNIGPFFGTQDFEVPLFLLTNSECQFLLAEAKQRGWIAQGKSAQQYYEDGIRASLDQYKYTWELDEKNPDKQVITDKELTDYLTAPGVTFNASKAFEQIATQKWISLYTNGQEAWSEIRRTGFPQIASLVAPFPGNTEMPRRRIYSTEEVKYNNANYNAAVARMGGDSQYTRVWWDGGK